MVYPSQMTVAERRRQNEQDLQDAAAAVRQQVSADAFITAPAKFMLSFERANVGDGFVASVFEWGQHVEEVSISAEDAAGLAAFLTARKA